MTLRTVTIFGGSGFVGRQLVQALARRGVVVRVATRDVKRVLHMKTSGAVGQVVPMRCNPTDAASVAGAVAGADAVINLIGILYERGKNTFQRMHVDVPEMIARAAAQAGIQHMVHISALGADANATSRYAQSKAMGEAALRAAHPDAVILRPSIIFGPEDDFFNRFARMCSWSPALPLIGGGKNKFQPVYVGDVVSAILTVLDNPITHGQTYELGGPAIYSFEQLLNYIMQQTGRKRMLCP
ncbi:MAG TPA: complex I NDUFA9 subunit family protein, partial [Alphaproteobacteria bacterium]|nr:complex I NDUFA9 subunit family protein [Alphaproteobacteria bacterium]